MTRHHLCLVAVIAACGSRSAVSTPTAQTEADARSLAIRAIDVLERDDLEGWRELLSAKVQRSAEPVEARRMFDAWKRFVVPHAQTLRAADWTIASDVLQFRTVGRQPERLVRVVAERGALRIDEN
jgi:hypothetical protein